MLDAAPPPPDSPASRPISRLLIVLLAGWLAACSGGPRPLGSLGTVTVATSIPSTQDGSNGAAPLVNSLALEALLMTGWDGRPVKGAIESWSWSADRLSLRLRLNPGIHFHDGTLLTNLLAAQSLRARLTPAKGVLSSSVASVEPDGTNDVVIRTRQPEGFLLSDISGATFSLPGKPHIGIGPFVVEATTMPITLRAFQNYYLGRPSIAGIKITAYDTQRQAYAAMMRREADVLYDVSIDSLDFVEAESALHTYPFTKAYYHALLFNLRLPTFAKRGVRQALNVAVDRQQIVQAGLRKRGMVADGPVWPYHFAHSQDQQAVTYNPALARALLDAEGLKVGSEVPAGAMPSRFHFTCLIPREDQPLQRIALLVQKQLFNIGVDLEVELVPIGDITRRVVTGRFEAALLPMAATRSLSFVYGAWHSPIPGISGGLNLGYASADAALDRLRGSIEDDDVRAAVKELQRVLYDDPPAVFLDWMETARAVTADIAVPDDGARDILRNIRSWRPAARSNGR